MLSIEPVNGKPEFRDLVKGTFDTWSDSAKFFIPTQYYNGVFDPVVRSSSKAAQARAIRRSTLKATSSFSFTTRRPKVVGYVGPIPEEIGCKEMLERRAKLQQTYKLLRRPRLTAP